MVYKIGSGYYGIDAADVTINESVHQAMKDALQKVSAIPAEAFKVRRAEQPERSPDTESISIEDQASGDRRQD